ncbi:MAG: O-antigen ligase family protein [Halomonas sp.]|uniref:O-antigen ligase family protein n=1 Tax=Halomonas sp. TaxID=1486246 RepID=UPI00397111C3
MRALMLLVFISLLVVLPSAHWGVPLFGLILLVPASAVIRLSAATRKPLDAAPFNLERDDWRWVLALLAYGSLWLLDVIRSRQWPADTTGWTIPLPLWPLLAAVFLIWLLRYPPGVRVFWVAVCCGALGAGSIAFYERLILGKARASNDLNPIIFGNLSLLLGSLSLLALLWCLRRGHARSLGLALLALLAGLFGIAGSLLSGTRGGWVALPFLLILWFRTSRGLLPAAWRYSAIAALAVVFIVAVWLPSTNVAPRLAEAVTEAQQFQAGDSRGSVGLRLEMWRGGLTLWSEKPWLGWTESGVIQGLHALIDSGEISSRVHRYRQLHSDVIDTGARRGLMGVATLLMLYGVPLWLFWGRLHSGCRAETQLMAGAGLMVCVAYIDFGLSQSMLRDPLGLSGYLGLCLACWASLRGTEARAIKRAAQQPAGRAPTRH